MPEADVAGLLDKLEADAGVVGDDEDAAATPSEPEETPAETTEEEAGAAPEGDVDESPAEGTEPEPAESPGASDAEVDKARRYLELKGIPHDGLNSEHLLDLRGAVARREAETDRALTERAELKKRLEELEAAKSEGVDNGQPAPGLDFNTTDFTEQFGEDATKALLAVLKPLRDKLASTEQTLQAQQQNATEQMLDGQRARLGERFPRLLESDDAWKAVVVDANGRVGDGTGAKELDSIFDDSATAIYGEPSAPTKRRASSQESKKRNTGQPSRASRRAPPETLSKDQKGTRLLEALEKEHGITD